MKTYCSVVLKCNTSKLELNQLALVNKYEIEQGDWDVWNRSKCLLLLRLYSANLLSVHRDGELSLEFSQQDSLHNIGLPRDVIAV